MNKQEFYRQEYRRLNPDWQDSLAIYRDIIDCATNSETKILDIGCGHGDSLKSVYNKTPHTYGIDPDQKALGKNTSIKNKIIGTAESLPFESNFFDLVLAEWVLEHLTNPEKSFREIYRVLKPDGKIIFLTPNAYNYNVWLIRLVPGRFHDLLARKLYNRQEYDTYPKHYKVNSIPKIAQTLEPIGFRRSEIILNGDPSYISFNRPLFAFACLLEKILDLKPFNSAKVHIIGIYKKTN